jgi:general stress protein 26
LKDKKERKKVKINKRASQKLEIVRSHNSLNKIWTSSLNHLNLATFNTICYLNSKRSASEDWRWFCTKSQLEIVRSHNSLNKIWTSSLNHLNLATFNTICYLNSKRSASEDWRWFCTKSQLEIVRSHNSLDKIWTSSFEPYYWQKVLVHPSYIPVRLGPLSFMIYD